MSPDSQRALHLALAHYNAGRLEQALAAMETVVALSPNDADVWHNRGLIQANLGRMVEAKESFERAIAIDPNDADSHFYLATTLLTLRDFERGWREYEWRLKMPLFTARHPTLDKPWRGEDLAG